MCVSITNDCAHAYAYVHTHVNVHAYAQVYTHVNAHAYTHDNAYTCLCTGLSNVASAHSHADPCMQLAHMLVAMHTSVHKPIHKSTCMSIISVTTLKKRHNRGLMIAKKSFGIQNSRIKVRPVPSPGL